MLNEEAIKTDPGVSRIMSSEKAEVLGLGKNRIEGLTDGIFATVMTILVLSLSIPVVTNADLSREFSDLGSLLPALAAYMVSFLVLGVYWVGHHNQFHWIRRTDRPFLWINIAFLMSIGLIPFSTALLQRYVNEQAPVIFYGLNLIACSTLLRSIWWYSTSGKRLVDQDLDPHIVSLASRRIAVGPVFFIVGIAIALLTTYTWLSILLYFSVAIFYVLPSHLDVHFKRRHAHD